VIGLDDLVEGADLGSLTDVDLAAMLCRLAAAQARLAAYLSARRSPQSEDHLLDADEAARILDVRKQWLYRNSKKLPFVIRLGGKVRFSAIAIERYLKARRGA
jgi:predicted DNA-binding transcriptional regulator AlpA